MAAALALTFTAGVIATLVVLVIGSMVFAAVVTRRDGRREAAHDEALDESRARAEVLFSMSPEPMWVWDFDSLAIVDANVAASRALGWTRDELLRMTVTELQLDASPRDLRARPYEGEWRHRRNDGSVRWMTVTTSTVRHAGRDARLSLAHDLTAQREADAQTRAIADSATDAILTIDLDGRVESVNLSARHMFGRAAVDLVGASVADLMRRTDGTPVERRIPEIGRELLGVRADGTTFSLEVVAQDIELGDRTVSTMIVRDVTERKALERRLTSQLTHDPLTGLPNRMLFIDRLTLALARAERTGRSVGVLFCGIDRFKVINDSLGHTAGDALLFALGSRFREAVRTADTVARFGGDEFVVLVENLTDAADAIRVADQLTDALRGPVDVGPQHIHVTASIGVAVGLSGTDSADGLVRDADVAMHRAKTKGRDRVEVFDAGLRQQALERLQIEGAMRAGLDHHEFVVHYQPEIELATNRIVGLEALVRWERPGDGTRSPAAFLPIAEETGLISLLGESVLVQACAEAARWHAELGDRAPTIWVNISARQLASLDLVPIVEAAVRSLPRPSALGLEITETDLVPDDEISRNTMQALVDIGVKLAIDDFGTGFASLSYLWRFPAHVVKVDQSFVRRMEDDRDARVLVKAMIDMAHSLGKTIVAEGVETEAQLAQLRALGADTVQGYLLAKPQPASSINALLAAV